MKTVIKKATTIIGAILCLGSLILTTLWLFDCNFIEHFDYYWSRQLFSCISYFTIPALLLAIYFLFAAFSKKCPQALVRFALVFSFVLMYSGVQNGLIGVEFYGYGYSSSGELTLYVEQLIVSAVALVAIVLMFTVNLKHSKKSSLIVGVIASIIYAVAGSYYMMGAYRWTNGWYYFGYVCLATSLPLVYIAALCDCNAKGRQDEAKNIGFSSQSTDQPVAPPCSTNPYGIGAVTPRTEVAAQSDGGVMRISSANFCSHCGNKLDGDEKHCQHCGNKVI